MKMKSIVLSALAIVVALTSCNKENNSADEPIIAGKSTYASFSVNVKDPGTYAVVPGDNNADAVEQTITSVRLFIFNGGVLETIGDINVDKNTNMGTASLKTTTGAKVIYAVANANDDMTMTVGQTLAQFKVLAVSATPDVLAEANQFVIIGNVAVTLIERTEAEALAAPIAINQVRATAKVQMQYDPAKVTVNNKVKGIFTDPNYQLAQCNTAMFLPREGYEFSPKGKKTEQIDADGNGTYDHLQPIKYGSVDEINAFNANYKPAVTSWNSVFSNSFYMAENVNEMPTTGNSTFALIRMKYSPDAAMIEGTNTPDNANGTFYAVRKTDGSWVIYVDKSEADTEQALYPYTNKVGATVTTAKIYSEGMCYYRINIRNLVKSSLNEKYAALRNNFYKINITEINSIGGNSPIDTDVIVPVDPTTPLETETHINADITVMPWTVIEMNEPLN